jgi:hypothetical protein
MQVHDSATTTVVAADAAFAAWADGDGPDGKPARLAALAGPFLRELEALRPPKGAGQNECVHSVVIESAHEYKNRTLFARKLTIPEACSLQVRPLSYPSRSVPNPLNVASTMRSSELFGANGTNTTVWALSIGSGVVLCRPVPNPRRPICNQQITVWRRRGDLMAAVSGGG